jgi:hypothetical protein
MSKRIPDPEAAARREARRHAAHVDDVVRSIRIEAHRRGRTVAEELGDRWAQWPGRQVWIDAARALGVELEEVGS